jgi:2-C-methyl-D-erythritol 2,4-cyclodiphosphate synthase
MSGHRIGTGYDVHRLGEGRPLVVGGVEIPFDKGVIAHSDGDVLLHALMDALLGALALGDIGQQFPDDDPSYSGASSRAMLREVMGKVRESGHRVGNIDGTIICEAPKMASHIATMRTRIAEDIGCPEDAIGIKATTHEGLGAIGRGEGIAAQVVVLLVADR